MKKTFKFDKLIRDKLHKRMVDIGIDVTLKYPLCKDELIHYFKNKVLEEAQEVVDAQSRCDMIEELADLTEVLHAIAKIFDLTLGEIENARKQKFAEKGGFDDGVVVDYVSLDASHEFVKYYEKYPEKYRTDSVIASNSTEGR
jgi:predicted house-cleaning noncanonical NTP pyrophosphatase (MazG superfamily)